MGKKLVFCKNTSKLATSKKVKIFFGSVGDTYKGLGNFRNLGFKILFLKNPTRREFPRHPTSVRNKQL